MPNTARDLILSFGGISSRSKSLSLDTSVKSNTAVIALASLGPEPSLVGLEHLGPGLRSVGPEPSLVDLEHLGPGLRGASFRGRAGDACTLLWGTDPYDGIAGLVTRGQMTHLNRI
jgi:hypothetical protein